MPLITLYTTIHAPPARAFDLARSIDLHKLSTEQTGEEAVAGTTVGLIRMGETVTWRARHFGVMQTLTSQITAYDRPHSFTDTMVQGAFKRLTHQHLFKSTEGGTLMTDLFDYNAPLGPLGRMAERLLLTVYLTRLLEGRNSCIKAFAESDRWKMVPGLIAEGPTSG